MPSQWYIATIRHGETDYNKEGRYAGTIDIGLNDAGREDARRASKKVCSMSFDICLTSPFQRAIETAQLLTEGQIEIIPCHHAQERNYGAIEGLTSTDIEHIRPPIHFIKKGGDYHSLDPPKAESFMELHDRAQLFLDHLLEQHNGQKVLVVSHGAFLQQFHGLLRGQDWMEALASHVGNLELTIFRMDDRKAISEQRIQLMQRVNNSF